MFLPWISLSWALSLNPGEQAVTETRCYPTIPTLLPIQDNSLPLQLWSKHPSRITVCSAVEVACLLTVYLTSQRQQCLLQCRPALPSPSSEGDSSQSLSACSFIRKTDTPSFYDWRAAINTPQSIYGCWWALSIDLTLFDPLKTCSPLPDSHSHPPPHTLHLPAFIHLLGCIIITIIIIIFTVV